MSPGTREGPEAPVVGLEAPTIGLEAPMSTPEAPEAPLSTPEVPEAPEAPLSTPEAPEAPSSTPDAPEAPGLEAPVSVGIAIQTGKPPGWKSASVTLGFSFVSGLLTTANTTFSRPKEV